MYYHKMINSTNKITTSLHLYSPPSYKMNIFDLLNLQDHILKPYLKKHAEVFVDTSLSLLYNQ